MSERPYCDAPHLFSCGTSPGPGETVWKGDREYVVTDDWQLQPVTSGPILTRRRRMLNYLADAIFCTECLRLRISPGHWLARGWHS